MNQNDRKPSIARAAPALVAAAASVWLGAAPAPSLAAAEPATTPGPARVQSLQAIARRAEEAVRAALPAAPPAPVAAATVADGPPAPVHRITARAPDPRLRLPDCPAPLEAAVPLAAGGLRPRIVVQVGCSAALARWTVLVPVTLETDAPVLVATRRLARGARPGPGEVVLSTRTLPGISTLYISNLNEIIDQHLIRPIDAGQPLTRDALGADPVVRRGEAVTLVADMAGVEVRMPGRALADARPGETVRAQNVNSLKIVEGRADDSGRVRVDR